MMVIGYYFRCPWLVSEPNGQYIPRSPIVQQMKPKAKKQYNSEGAPWLVSRSIRLHQLVNESYKSKLSVFKMCLLCEIPFNSALRNLRKHKQCSSLLHQFLTCAVPLKLPSRWPQAHALRKQLTLRLRCHILHAGLTPNRDTMKLSAPRKTISGFSSSSCSGRIALFARRKVSIRPMALQVGCLLSWFIQCPEQSACISTSN